MVVMQHRPTAYFRKKFFRSDDDIGTRADLFATSSVVGCGTRLSIAIKIKVGTRKITPEKNGIQFSLIPLSRINFPTDFETPSETMKLAQSPAINASVFFLPSKKPSTNPNTVPKNKPFNNRQRIFHGRGMKPNSNNI